MKYIHGSGPAATEAWLGQAWLGLTDTVGK